MSDRPRRAWTEPTGAEASGIDRRSPQWWSAHWRRTAAVLAILVLLIGTHIPRLELGPPDDGPDKLLHFFAFGVVATLLRISSLGRSTLRTAFIAGTLALLDDTDAWRRPERFADFLVACTAIFDLPETRADYLRRALARCRHIDTGRFRDAGVSGPEIGEGIRRERLRILEEMDAG